MITCVKYHIIITYFVNGNQLQKKKINNSFEASRRIHEEDERHGERWEEKDKD